ncbi:Diphthamide synthesis DPH1/DPH2 [Dipodascopsis tothii]|uniref:Diphthamide synthesis DPH1/DPH2 n=1 Tax=Dipodascopsis tothii TaxID=44089 RepID=UPI0034CF5E51
MQGRSRIVNQIPADILEDEDINAAIALLPSNYNFEIHKSIWNVRTHKAKKVALQMPEGLLIYSCIVSDILERFCGVEILIMGDVTYGACCIDDFTAKALGCDFLIHYAHSCLVPMTVTTIKVLYVFVSIGINFDHLVASVEHNFEQGTRFGIVSTIQFNTAIHSSRPLLEAKGYSVYIPQRMPLSKGEILGCTSPLLDKNAIDALLYVGDGRFHLESAMIQNPEIPAYRYDPYSRKFTREGYGHEEMQTVRRDAIRVAKTARKVAIILGTLGRQGNYATLEKLKRHLQQRGIEYVLILLSEIFPEKLAEFNDVDAFIQIACPRLSIDWGYAFDRPLLTPYEALVALNELDEWTDAYPMNFYATDGLGRTRPGS